MSHWTGSARSDLSGGDLRQRLSSAQSHHTTQGGDLRDRLNSHREGRVRDGSQAHSVGVRSEVRNGGNVPNNLSQDRRGNNPPNMC